MESLVESGLENKYLNSCCCCLQESCFKDISTEYYSSGQKEVYSDMLKNTFNIQINNQDISGSSTHMQFICEPCISRLRDAAVFKQMVIDVQDVISDHLKRVKSCGGETNQLDASIEVSSIKVEAFPLADTSVDDEAAADDNFDDNETLSNVKKEMSKNVENATAQRKRKTQTRRTKPNISKIEGEVKDTSTPVAKDWRKLLERRGSGPLLRDNSLKLLAHSTGCVFQWNKSRYRCFCCKEPFSDLTSLKNHTESTHTLDQIERKIISQQNRLVKVEISTLNCKLCSQKTDNLTSLRDHLTEKHGIEFVKTEDLLVPFKINGQLQCQLCSEKFTVFRLLNIHMNRHYQKHVCHICGSGFSNSVFLNLHKTRSHRPLKCKQCDMTFPNRTEKKTHDISAHGIKFERKLRFPCPYCPQRFFQENFRVEHLVEKHGLPKPEHKCDVCSKVFITKSLCNNHVKTVHMKEKCHSCDICRKLFYNKSDVARHRVTHTQEKRYSCNVCNSPFATRDSLRRHHRRTHAVQ